MTGTWTADQLDAVDTADELYISPARPDGSLRRAVTIWVVRLDNDLYIRSANGREAGWYSHVASTRRAHIIAGGVEADVIVVDASGDAALTSRLQVAYHQKYDRYGESVTRGALSTAAQDATLRLVLASTVP